MRYIKFFGGNGYCGCDFKDYQVFDDDITDSDLEEIAHDLGMENAESYEYVVTGWYNDFESQEERDDYYGNIDFGWEEITKEEYEENS